MSSFRQYILKIRPITNDWMGDFIQDARDCPDIKPLPKGRMNFDRLELYLTNTCNAVDEAIAAGLVLLSEYEYFSQDEVNRKPWAFPHMMEMITLGIPKRHYDYYKDQLEEIVERSRRS